MGVDDVTDPMSGAGLPSSGLPKQPLHDALRLLGLADGASPADHRDAPTRC